MKLKRIGVLSVGKVAALLYACMGLIGGLFLSLFSTLGLFAAAQSDPDIPFFLGPFLGIGAVIFMPLFYGALGFIVGVIASAIYNGISAIVGGIELELETLPGLPPEHRS